MCHKMEKLTGREQNSKVRGNCELGDNSTELCFHVDIPIKENRFMVIILTPIIKQYFRHLPPPVLPNLECNLSCHLSTTNTGSHLFNADRRSPHTLRPLTSKSPSEIFKALSSFSTSSLSEGQASNKAAKCSVSLWKDVVPFVPV